MKLSTLWIVRTPTTVSCLEDVCFEADPTFLADYIRGIERSAWRGEGHTLYTDRHEAELDARLRLAKRDGVTHARAETCLEFLMGLTPEDVDAMGLPEGIMNAASLFESSTTDTVTQRGAIGDMVIELADWLRSDRRACVAAFGPGLCIEEV